MSLLAAVAVAALSLHKPIDCTLGKNCFIQNYVDQDTAPGEWRDFSCGALTYDGHKGTDFRLINLKQMQKGVNVLAVADGEVVNFRDGMKDISIRDKDANPHTIQNLECGNGVLLKHEGGMVSQYCHLKQGSVKVKKDQKIKAGAVLGQVGLSGQTEFPHVHVELRTENGTIIDPFQPNRKVGSCSKTTPESLWSKRSKIAYQATGVLQTGWMHTAPRDADARAGRLDGITLTSSSPAIIFWADLFGLRDGDMLNMDITLPTGQEMVKLTQPIKGNKAVFFQFAGKKLTLQRWQTGTYHATLSIVRNGKKIIEKTNQLVIQ